MTLRGQLLFVALILPTILAVSPQFTVWRKNGLRFGEKEVSFGLIPNSICQTTKEGDIRVALACENEEYCPISPTFSNNVLSYSCETRSPIDLSVSLEWLEDEFQPEVPFEGFSLQIWAAHVTVEPLEEHFFPAYLYAPFQAPYDFETYIKYSEPRSRIDFEIDRDIVGPTDLEITVSSSLPFLMICKEETGSCNQETTLILPSSQSLFSIYGSMLSWDKTTAKDSIFITITAAGGSSWTAKLRIRYYFDTHKLNMAIDESNMFLVLETNPSSDNIRDLCPGCVAFTPFPQMNPVGLSLCSFSAVCDGSLSTDVGVYDGMVLSDNFERVGQKCTLSAIITPQTSTFPYSKQYPLSFGDSIASVDFVFTTNNLRVPEDDSIFGDLTEKNIVLIVCASAIVLLGLLVFMLCGDSKIVNSETQPREATATGVDQKTNEDLNSTDQTQRTTENNHFVGEEEIIVFPSARESESKDKKQTEKRGKSTEKRQNASRPSQKSPEIPVTTAFLVVEEEIEDHPQSPADVFETPKLNKERRKIVEPQILQQDNMPTRSENPGRGRRQKDSEGRRRQSGQSSTHQSRTVAHSERVRQTQVRSQNQQEQPKQTAFQSLRQQVAAASNWNPDATW